MSIRALQNLADIVPQYKALLLDLWGVIHDGTTPYPGVKERLEALQQAGKQVMLLSNAPRRAGEVVKAMEAMGLGRHLYQDIMTSGEACYLDLGKRHEEGATYMYVGLEKDRGVLNGLGYREVRDASQASFLLCTHSFHDNQPIGELNPILNACMQRRLPMLCTNPDMEIVRMSGERVYCAGKLAQDYAKRGGEVVYYGKPHQLVYDFCFERLPNVDRKAILAVGDSLSHDIKGGNEAGIDTALVTGGILKERLTREPLEAICAEIGAMPTYSIPTFG